LALLVLDLSSQTLGVLEEVSGNLIAVLLLAVEDMSLSVDLLLLLCPPLGLVGVEGVDSIDVSLHSGRLIFIVLTHLAFLLLLLILELLLMLASFLLLLDLLLVCYLLQLLCLTLEVGKLYIIYITMTIY
jgi:hypothetical protein